MISTFKVFVYQFAKTHLECAKWWNDNALVSCTSHKYIRNRWLTSTEIDCFTVRGLMPKSNVGRATLPLKTIVEHLFLLLQILMTPSVLWLRATLLKFLWVTQSPLVFFSFSDHLKIVSLIKINVIVFRALWLIQSKFCQDS